MSISFNEGKDTSSLGTQFNDKFWSRAAIVEAKKKKTFSQLAKKEVQPKHYGDKLVKYHELPILHAANINDQGIDANGVKMVPGKWYAYDAGGTRIGEYDSKQEAKSAAGTTGTIKSGNGNLFGGSKDIAVQRGAFPALTEEGGAINQVGMKRLTIEGKVKEYGFAMTFTKKSLDMDTETGLLARYSKGVGEAYGDTREAQLRSDLLAAGELNAVYAGAASTFGEMDSTCTLTFQDLRLMDNSLKEARCPKDTEIINGTTKVGTVTVGKARYVYVPSSLIPTLEDMKDANGKDLWIPVEMYAAGGTIAEDEIGKIGQFRFIEVEEMPHYEGVGADSDADDNDESDEPNFFTTHTATNEWKYDVFPVLFVGSGSFATIGFSGDVARVTTVMPKADAHNDFFGKKGVVSISWYYGFMALRPEWIKTIFSTAKIS